MRRCGPTTTRVSWCAPARRAAWPTRCATTSPCCSWKKPGGQRHRMSDGLGDWGGAEFVLAADRLDTPDVIEAADPGDMLRQVASAAAQVRTALRSCQEADLSAFTPDARPRAVVVAGMGGSGLAGELLSAMAGPSSPVQVVTAQTERLPGWIGAADAV